MAPQRLATAGVAGALALAFAGACLKPTQLTLQVTTDVQCSRLQGTSIYGGLVAVGANPLTTTRDCRDGSPHQSIGTLVLAPRGSEARGESVIVTVVAGVDTASETCAEKNFVGCIVARRKLRYAKHEPLDVPILLSESCKSVVCGIEETCVPCTKEPCEKPKCAPAETPDVCQLPGSQCNVASASGSVDASGDATIAVITDAGPKVFRLAIPKQLQLDQKRRPRALAATPTKVYWTIGTALRSVPMAGALTGAGQVDDLFGEPLAGVDAMDVNGTPAVVAAGSATAFFRSSVATSDTATTASGVAFLDGPANLVFLAETPPRLWDPRDGGVTDVLSDLLTTPNGYARRIGPGRVLFGAGSVIGEYYVAAKKDAVVDAGLGPPGRQVLGVAAVNDNLYVTAASSVSDESAPNVFVRRGGDPTWAPLGVSPQGVAGFVPGPEDLLTVDNVPGSPGVHLLVAGQDGIWVLEGIE